MINKAEIKNHPTAHSLWATGRSRKLKFQISAFCFLLLLSSVAYGQIPTCINALAASPQGPFPCSVNVTWNDNATNETGYIVERRLNAAPWITLGGKPTAANVTSLTDTTLQQSATVDNVYDYKVSATNSAGTSPGVNPVFASFTIPVAVVKPGAPTGITVTFKGGYGELTCPTCAGGDRRVPLNFDEGKLVISSAAEITVDIKY